jgi:hypothetical protein
MILYRAMQLVPLIAALACSTAIPRGARPKAGLVPDAATAIRIAEAVWIPLYGEKNTLDERPYRAALEDGVWKVTGTLHCAGGGACTGGTAYAEISRDDGRIIFVTHYQ